MGVFGGPEIPNDGLVLALDAGNPRNFNLTAVEVLVVAGGGGAGHWTSGGGGGGGVIYNRNFTVTPGSALTTTVGGGGANAGSSGGSQGSNGENSVFGSLTATGGGGGGGINALTGRNGASGGGGGGGYSGGSGGSGTSGQGFAGGNGTSSSGAGGGGSGSNGGINLGGNGGVGLGFNISGTFTYYAGGGGGGTVTTGTAGTGGLGGGGNGSTSTGSNGSANTGGGGGGGGEGPAGGNGGSGIVIVRYPGPQKAIGGTVTSVGGDTIHTFTTSGNFTPLVNTNGSAVLGLSDLSGNRNFGTSVNGPTYSSANGGSIVFDGVDDYVDCVLNSGLTGTGSWTMSAWFKINGAPSAGLYQNAIVDTDATGSSANMICTDWSGYHGGSQNQLLYTSRPSTGGSYTNLLGPVLTQGIWYNATVVRNGTTDTKLYTNGSLSATYTGNIPTATQPLVRIGKWTDGTNYANCNISQVQIYNRALSAAEVSQNYNALRRRFEGKVFYYEGNDARNFVSNWNDQEIFNMTTTADLGNCYIHGWGGSPRSYTLALTNLPTHTEVRYECYIHMVDSLDNETSEIYTRNSAGTESLAVRWTKQYNQVPNVSTLATGMIFPFKTGQTYSYRPWGNGAYGNDGYASFDTGFYAHTGSNFSIRHYFGADQGSNDEAYYISHVKLTIRYL